MRTRLLAFASTLLALPAVAGAQVIYVSPSPGVYVAAPPPQYLGAIPPHVYIRQRIRWHLRRAADAIVAQAPYYPPAPVPYYPPPPPPLPPIPPPLVAPAPQVYYYAPPAPMPATVLVAAPAPRPGWSSRIGLGVRGTGQVVNDSWNNLGIGGEILYRASNHLSLEIAGEYQKNSSGPIDRMDVPVTLGLRVHIGKPHWIVSPYFVFAAGVDYASQDLHVTKDEAYYFDGQLGGGLELRLGQHVAITADGRFDGKKRMDDAAPAVLATRSVNGKPVHALGDEYGGQFRLGFAVYF